jgi:hypothetical protein
MDIKLPIPEEDRYKFILEVLSVFVSEFKQLRDREIELLAEFYKLNEKFKAVPLEDRYKLIFHSDNKKDIAEKMQVSMLNLNNLMKDLKKKGLLDELGIVKEIPLTNKINLEMV